MDVSLFQQFKDSISNIDPVTFIEKNLRLDGSDFKLHGNGYKCFADIYRQIGIKALEKNAKPIVLVKGRQVGATTMASGLELFFMASGLFGKNGRPPMRIIHVFPELLHVFTYAKTKFNPMMKSAKASSDPSNKKRTLSVIEDKLDKNSATSDSLQYKQFDGENFIRIESAGINGDRLMGGTVDCLIYDEVQTIPALAISNINKVLSKAKYGRMGEGVQIYFGTPRQKNSEYYKIWENSNQQYYYLGCEKCGEHFPLYTPGSNEWQSIWLYGFVVQCTHCGHTQDKNEAAERGKWVATKNTEDCKYIGFHINQLFSPNLSKEFIISQMPEHHELNTERTWQNEILGEFYAGESGPITPEEIREKCADFGRKMRKSISVTENKKIFVGFDWGKKSDADAVGKDEAARAGGQSYSTAVVLTEDGPGRLLIDFATILKKSNFDYKKDVVREIMRQYSVTQAVGDIGYANDLTEELQKEFGDRFLASYMATKVTNHIHLNKETFPQVINAEREYHIAELFSLMKKGVIRFPFGDWDKISWLVSHCCSMDIKTTFNNVKEPIRRYVKGSTPNDGFMALLNAYLAYKYHKTGGFSDIKMGPTDLVAKKPPMAILGYCKKL